MKIYLFMCMYIAWCSQNIQAWCTSKYFLKPSLLHDSDIFKHKGLGSKVKVLHSFQGNPKERLTQINMKY